jgi:hypothetical protein
MRSAERNWLAHNSGILWATKGVTKNNNTLSSYSRRSELTRGRRSRSIERGRSCRLARHELGFEIHRHVCTGS